MASLISLLWIGFLLLFFLAQSLAISVDDVNKFQLFAAITLDNIWRARNILVHDGVVPVSSGRAFSDFLFIGASSHGLERFSC